ncbi:hypothetical protein BKI52_22360 [marine bacterium AO1-C]|nr:hypothetical protein BKI52_22360 [marine bacterium AO1-C]
MKKYIVFTLVAAVMVLMQACGGGGNDNPTPTSTTDPNLLNTWKVSQVLENSLDITSEFTQYRITFAESGSSKTYTLVSRTGTTSTGTWALSTDGTSITLTPSGGTAVTLSGVSITATQLKYNADEAGKAGNVNLAFTLIPA